MSKALTSSLLAAGACVLLAASAQAQTPPASPPPQAAPAPAKMAIEPRAMELLKAASAKLAAAKTMSFTATVSYEYPSQLGPPILYTMRYDVALQRPDKLRVLIPGDGPASEFYYDGKSMTAYAPKENLVAVADAPPTIDGALKAAFDSADIYYPFTDLVVSNPDAALTEGTTLAFYIGPSALIDGTKTEMIAWANDDVFLQIWIGADDKLPRRVRAVYSEDPLSLRHQMDLTNWELDKPIAASNFASEKAKAAPRIKFDRPFTPPPPGAAKPLGGALPPAKSP
jgi:hypothetical protein